MSSPAPTSSTSSSLSPATPFQLARRTARMNSSVIRDLLKLVDKPGIISLAGGLPSPDTFPVEALRVATERVLGDTPKEAMQYGPSEGYAPLREWIAADLAKQGMSVRADQVLVTTGSQQALDLIGKALIDVGSRVAVEQPTYMGALQAFVPFEPSFTSIACDEGGPVPEGLQAAAGARFLYLLPNFQNPSGRCLTDERRAAIAEQAERLGLPIVEDNPYGELWFDAPPPRSIASRWPQGTIYMGSFSKVLAPGLRLGWVVAPNEAVGEKLVQAKQAADLHTPGFNQRLVYEVIRSGFLDEHVPTIRNRYALHRDAMQAALARHLPEGCHWQKPAGGMFFWVRLPEGIDAMRLLDVALAHNVAFIPGAPFFANDPEQHANTIRLSFVTVSPSKIDEGIAALAQALRDFPRRG